jgi:hypothetical protein
MATGNPKPNYYIGPELTSATLSSLNGLYHGGDVAPAKKFLHKISLWLSGTTIQVNGIICDYLMYYPLVDMDSVDEQFMTNTVPLPRYASGEGVMAILVATNPYVGGALFTLNYTNSDGTAGRQTIPVATNTRTNIGTVLQGDNAVTWPFIPLARGDRGIRSVESITFMAPNGGLAALVLVKPLATFTLPSTACFREVDFAKDLPSLPQIQDGAYLGMFVGNTATSIANNVLIGDITTIWN